MTNAEATNDRFGPFFFQNMFLMGMTLARIFFQGHFGHFLGLRKVFFTWPWTVSQICGGFLRFAGEFICFLSPSNIKDLTVVG